MSGYQLESLQEAITIVVLIDRAWLYLGESLRRNYALALVLILVAGRPAFKG